MRFVRIQAPPAGERGFTMVEVLAAMAFMAIVIPVAVAGLRLASTAGQVGRRKAVAARIAEQQLGEWSVGGQTQMSSKGGVEVEGTQRYEWTIRSQAWPQGAMQVVTALVRFQVQGKNYDVSLSTLAGGGMK